MQLNFLFFVLFLYCSAHIVANKDIYIYILRSLRFLEGYAATSTILICAFLISANMERAAHYSEFLIARHSLPQILRSASIHTIDLPSDVRLE